MAEEKKEVQEQKYTDVVFAVKNGSKEIIEYVNAKGENLAIKAGDTVSLKKREWGVGELARLARMKDVSIGGSDPSSETSAKSPNSGGDK